MRCAGQVGTSTQGGRADLGGTILWRPPILGDVAAMAGGAGCGSKPGARQAILRLLQRLPRQRPDQEMCNHVETVVSKFLKHRKNLSKTGVKLWMTPPLKNKLEGGGDPRFYFAQLAYVLSDNLSAIYQQS